MSAAGRRLVLVRHSKAARPKSTTDHERALTAGGVADARTLGTQLAAAGLVPDLALWSTSTRTRQTWAELASVWDASLRERVRVVEDRSLYEAAALDIREVLRSVAGPETIVLVCGHEPSMSALARDLAGRGSDPDAVDAVADGMRTSTAAVLDIDQPWTEIETGALVAVLQPRR